MIDQIQEYYQMFQDLMANNAFQDYGVIGLFLNSLLSATALPIPTEILTSALLAGGESEILVAIALITGSSIGGVMNYFIGFGGNKLVRFFKRKPKTILDHTPEEIDDMINQLGQLANNNTTCPEHNVMWIDERMRLSHIQNLVRQKPLVLAKKGHKFLDKFGWGAVFFSSWIPVAGDLILISAGAKKFQFRKFIVLMIAGKTVKTIAVVAGLGAVF